jgi:hypothetical protein
MHLIPLPTSERHPEIDAILEFAKEQKLSGIAIAGFSADGLDFLTYGRLSSAELLWLSEKLRQKALEVLK